MPIIEEAPLVMECSVEDIYDSDNFDNFILKIQNTYAEPSVLSENGTVDYMKIKPVLFDMPNNDEIKKALALKVQNLLVAELGIEPKFVSVSIQDIFLIRRRCMARIQARKF